MSYKNPKAHETWPFIFRKKFKLSALDPAVTAVNIWQPPPNRTIHIVAAYYRVSLVQPTGATDPGTKPTIKLDQGATNIVAATNLSVADVNKKLTLANDAFLTFATPLTLTTTLAGGTAATKPATTFNLSIIFVAYKLTD